MRMMVNFKEKKEINERGILLFVPSTHYNFATAHYDASMNRCLDQACKDNVTRINLFNVDTFPIEQAETYFMNIVNKYGSVVTIFCKTDFDVDNFFMSFENDEI